MSDLKREALEYHEMDPPGKIAIRATKPLINQADLALAYSPGVAHACMAIVEDPSMVDKLTARANGKESPYGSADRDRPEQVSGV